MLEKVRYDKYYFNTAEHILRSALFTNLNKLSFIKYFSHFNMIRE